MRIFFGSGSVIQRLKTKPKILLASISLVFGLMGISTLTSVAFAATPTVVYNAIPNPLPANVPSLGYEATQTSEFGDYIHLGGTDRVLNTVTVTMSDWAEYSTYATNPTYSANSTSWTYPITLNIYSNQLGANGVPDDLLASVTTPITIPWRPAGDPSCPTPSYGDGFMSGGVCYNGLAFNASFNMSSLGITLPNDLIVSVAYNTENYGAAPTGVDGPYNSLNVGVPDNAPVTVGTDDNANNVFWNTSTAGWYADGGASGVGTFRQDTNWAPNGTVAFEITATTPVPSPTIVSPYNGDILLSSQLKKINWTNVSDGSGPVTYQYQAFSDPGYTKLVDLSSSLSASQISTLGTPPGTYYIQVRAQDGNGLLSDWSNSAADPYEITVVAPTPPPTTKAECRDQGWTTYNDPSFWNKDQCIDYVVAHEHEVSGNIKYTAYGLKRQASFDMNTADNSGWFSYSDNNRGWYNVNITDVSVSGNDGYFAGVVTSASNHSWVGQWLFGKVQNGHTDLIWGSFTTQTNAMNGVQNMTSPADGPFNVTQGNLKVR